MRNRIKNSLLIGLSAMMTGAFAAACAACSKEEGKSPEYTYNYAAPLHSECDPFMSIDGKLDEEAWQGQKYLYWCGSESQCEVKATTVFTHKGLYLGLMANDTAVRWSNRYAVSENSGFEIQIVKADEKNYNNNVNYVHPSQSFMFNIDAKNALSRSERRFDAAGYCKGELNGETEYISAELFLPWSEMNYKEEEFNENGTPDAVKIYVRYTGISYGMAGFSDYNQFETYYTYNEHGSTCEIDRNSETDSVGYSVNGWTPGDRWEIDQENKVAENTVSRTQMLWFRKDVNGVATSTGTHYLASVKVKAINERSPFVGFITLRNKVTFNIYGVQTNDLQSGKLIVSSGQKTNGMRSVWDKHFLNTYAENYEGEEVNGEKLGKDEVYLTVAKRGGELYYFVNGKYVGMEYDVRVADKCTIGIFANGRTIVSDWKFEDFTNNTAGLDEYLNNYLWFVTQQDDSHGYIVTDKTVAKHGDSVNIGVMPKPGYILTKLTLNGKDYLNYFLENADDNAAFVWKPESNLHIEAKFGKLPKEGLIDIAFVLDGDDGAKAYGATYIIRGGNDKRLVYKGEANNKGNIQESLLKAGTYTIDEQTIEISGNYTIEIESKGYKKMNASFELPQDFSGDRLEKTLTLESYPYGSVTVNGKTAASKGTGIYDYNSKNDNIYTSDDSFINFNTQYLKNMVFTGDYIFKAEVSLTEDSKIANGRYGSIVGYAMSSGGRYIELKTASWIADKLYLNLNSSCEIGLSGFPVTNEAGNTGFYKNGACKNFTVSRYKDVIYVTNNEGILCFTMSEKGIELYHSALVEGGARFDTFNKGVKQFFKDGTENAFALYNLRSNEGGGAYRFAYDFEINPKDLSDVLKTATVDLKSGELYNLDASGTAVGNAYICGIPVKLTFTTVPAKYNYCVTVEYEDGEKERILGEYDKAKGEYRVTTNLLGNATVWLEQYDLGEATANGEILTAPRGDALTKNADGTYQSEYKQNRDVLQYYSDMKATGDFILNAEIMVVGDTAPERIDAGRVGSGVGIVLACGTDKELVIFSNKVNQDKLIFMVNTTRGGTMVYASGFKNVENHLGVLGAGIKFTVQRIGNALAIYDKNGQKRITVSENGEIKAEAGVALTGNAEAMKAHLGAMLSAGSETAFGIYREFNYKGEYRWNVGFAPKANGEDLSVSRGDPLTKNADGTYRNIYSQMSDILQYYPDMKATGDFTFDAEVTVTGNTKPERKDANNVGSGVGFVISCGTDKELAIFSNKVNQDKLILLINAKRGGTILYLTGFKNVNNHLGELGAGIKFSVKRAGNTLEIYDKNGNKGVTVNEDGTIKTEAGFGVEGNSEAVGAHVATMLKAGNETVFGVYREFNYKGEYTWNAALEKAAD